jgi:YspA, cpYpsA-related SLOG family
MRLLVCGGRDYYNHQKVNEEIPKALNWESTDDMETWLPPIDTVIISGGAKGADSLAIDWAVVHWCKFEEYKANWENDGKGAGPVRNQRMLDEGKPDKVLAFPGGKGTADMIRRAKRAGIPVIEIT